MKTARDQAHELAAGIVPACYSLPFDDYGGTTIEHSHHCDFLTSAFEDRDREVRAAALRWAASVAVYPRCAEELRELAARAERG